VPAPVQARRRLTRASGQPKIVTWNGPATSHRQPRSS
jgi:hypothetical protein